MRIFIFVVIIMVAIITLGFNSFMRSRDLKDSSIRTLLFVIIFYLMVVCLCDAVLPDNWSYIGRVSPFSFLFAPLMYFLIRSDSKDIPDNVIHHHRIPFYISILFYVPFILWSELRIQWSADFYFYWNSALVISWLFYFFLILHTVYRRGGIREQPPFAQVNVFLYFIFTVAFALYIRSIYLDQSSSFLSLLLVLLSLLVILNIYQEQLRGLKKVNWLRVDQGPTFQSMILDTIQKGQDTHIPSLLVALEVSLPSKPIETNILERLDYLDPDLNLQVQASKLSMTTSQLSNQIKELSGETFLNYINRLRINHAVRKLEEHPSMDIDILISTSGFNSRASFYRNFKKYTGTTPTEFIKRQQDI